SPADLKTLLCPLFATNAQQQETFYRTFDACYPWFVGQGTDGRDAARGAQTSPVQGRPAFRKHFALGLVAIALAVVIGISVWRTTACGIPKAAPTVLPSSTLPQPPPVVPETTRTTWPWYTVWQTELDWIALVGPLSLVLAWKLYRFRRRRLM